MEIEARAKINLFLKITGRRENMHVLDTVMTPIDLFDTVIIKRTFDDEARVYYDGKESAYPSDTALKAARLIRKRYNLGGVRIDITKRIPEGAGLGGSSADAAAVARGMEALFNYGKTDISILTEIGSDVYPMYFGETVRVKGIGDEVTPLKIARKPKFILCVSKKGVSTEKCYGLYDIIGGEDGEANEIVEALKNGESFIPCNDLYPAAVKLNPEVRLMREALEKMGFTAGMTGSGCGVFGYDYDEEAFEIKAERLRAEAHGKFEIYTL